jgi:conjugative relaxase-like TrwC/TraI family protein
MADTPLCITGTYPHLPDRNGDPVRLQGVMTMSIHKLSAGSGYDYLTRQVAALDATDKGHVGLASYYTERGETPGAWIGSGMAGIDGLSGGDAVTAEQMRALFGAGMHPLAAQRLEQLDAGDLTDANIKAATRLGAPFKIYVGDVSPFRVEVAKRIAAQEPAARQLGGDRVSAAVRAQVRTEVAQEFFKREYGRDPIDARELSATIAKQSRPRTQTVAGYDLTFSPVKSVSTLWAVADPHVAAQIEQAHHAAVQDALSFIERHALFTRQGRNGIRQVNVTGLVAAAFTHRDSRDGDPDLHTHVAVANKVQTRDGRWLSIDGRVLFKATVAASETYNTALEQHLRDRLGVRFADRPDTDPRKPPIREIVGVDPALNQRWSTRRMLIKNRQGELAKIFQRDHGRPPTPVEALHLAQQATLETRDPKHEPRSLAEQRAAWHAQAAETLGGPQAVQAMISRTLHTSSAPSPAVDAEWVAAAAEKVLTAVEQRRSTWQIWHVRAEAQRQIRAANITTDKLDQLVDLLVAEVLTTKSVPLTSTDDTITEPVQLRRVDGSSVYTVADAELFSSTRILEAERRLVANAGRTDGHAVDPVAVDLALLEAAANAIALDAGQATLVRSMATSGARLQLAIAPAGAGKTTALRTLTHAWLEGGGQVLGLAPSAAAAAQLRDQTGAPTDTLAKLTWSLHHLNEPAGGAPDWLHSIGPSTLVLIDEAGMADTLTLDTAVQFIVGRSGSVRLIGDDQQLASIGAGGVLRDIENTYGAVRLTELHRFHDPAEAAASLALRDGRPEALGFYLDRQRIHVGGLATVTQNLFDAWRADRSRGLDSIMLAPTRDLGAELNRRARAHRLGTTPMPGPAVALADGNRASAGELIITRKNDRRLRMSASDWVKNGDRWIVLTADRDGGLRVQHRRTGRVIHLPASYIRDFVELGYATTIHSAQGITADTMHGLIIGTESRRQLYTMCTRGRLSNHIYLELVGDGDPYTLIRPDTIRPATATELLEHILARDDNRQSASTMRREQQDPALRLANAVERYVDALHLAAEDVVGSSNAQALEGFANQLVPGLTEEPAWPTLRASLLLLAADGADPYQHLHAAYHAKEIDSADDRAAVLDWRLDHTSLLNRRDGPLPWLSGIPDRIAADPNWGPYMAARSRLISDLADQVRRNAAGETPAWAAKRHAAVPAELIADMQIWRAATQVGPGDLRPTGPSQIGHASRIFQQQLDMRLADTNPDRRWQQLLATEVASVNADPFLPELAERLSNLTRAGFDATLLVRSAAAAGPLPDDHPAAALWWRILDQLPPQLPRQATPAPAVPATKRITARPRDPRPPRLRSVPPPASGPSR